MLQLIAHKRRSPKAAQSLRSVSLATVFSRNDILAYLQREEKKGNLVRIKNKSTQASERTTPIVAGYSLNASVDTTVTQNHRLSIVFYPKTRKKLQPKQITPPKTAV